MLKKKPLFYTDAETGERWPLVEAEVNYSAKVYKTDSRKAIIGSTSDCIIALGLKHDTDVLAAYVGAGKDAYVVFKGKGRLKAHAKHYVILAEAARVRDTFDTRGAPKTQWITLSAPTAGRTREARRLMGIRRRKAIKNGARVNHRSTPNVPRITRIGAAHRARAIIDNGTISVPATKAA